MLDDGDAGDAPCEVEADQRVDRLARVGRDAHQVGGEEQIAEERVVAVDRRGGRLALQRTEAAGLRKKALRLRVACVDALRRRAGAGRDERGQRDRCDDDAACEAG